MSLLITTLVSIYIICPILVYFSGRKDRKINRKRKKSSILFNAVIIERNVTPEEVFETLDKAGIKPNFIQNESN